MCNSISGRCLTAAKRCYVPIAWPAELKQVRQVIEELLQSLQPRVTEDEVERELIAEVVIAPVKMNDSEGYGFYSYKPIKVGGQPLSES